MRAIPYMFYVHNVTTMHISHDGAISPPPARCDLVAGEVDREAVPILACKDWTQSLTFLAATATRTFQPVHRPLQPQLTKASGQARQLHPALAGLELRFRPPTSQLPD